MEPPTGTVRTLETLVAQLREAAGPNLLGVALYGGLAKGRFTPGISDVNVLVVVADAALERLLPLAPALTAGLRDGRVVPFVVTTSDLRDLVRLFPGKLLDMRESHRVLWGDVHLAGLSVAPEDLRGRARQEVKNAELRLRGRAVERNGEASVLWRGLLASLPKLAVTLETLLRAGAHAVPADRPSVLRLAARELGVATERMEPFAALHRTDRRPPEAEVRRLYGAYLELLAGLARQLEGAAG